MRPRSQDINNRIQWTNAYYQMRQAHRAYIADHTRLSMDEITKIAHDAAPKRLDAEQLDPTTGKIHWPIILQDPKYIEACDELDNLFKSRATISGFIGAESYRDINKGCDTLFGLLKSNIDEYSPNDFQQAKHFIDSLRDEFEIPSLGLSRWHQLPDHAVEKLCQTVGCYKGILSQPQHILDAPRAAKQRARRGSQPAGRRLLRHEAIQILGQFIFDGVADHAYGKKTNLVLPANFTDGPRFHIDRERRCSAPTPPFRRACRSVDQR